MLSKRRKAANTADEPEPEPKKRATRSSSRLQKAGQGDEDAESEPVAPKRTNKMSKTSDPKTYKATQKSEKEPKKHEISKASQLGNDAGPSNLTITHELVKNPIACHHYAPEKDTAAPTLIFTHGAGGTLSADAVLNFCAGYSTNSPVIAFQGSMNLAARVKGFHACLSHLNSTILQGKKERERFALGGRSMGSRAAVIAGTELLASASKKDVSLILISYPLKGPKDIRDQILQELPSSARVLFVIGDRDAMCPLDLLNDTRKKMKAASQLVVVKGADHGMHVTKAAGRNEKELGGETGRLAARWVDRELGGEDIEIGAD